MSERVKVCLRIRPRCGDELRTPVAVWPSSNADVVVGGRRQFTFDRVFDSTDPSEVIYSAEVAPLLDSYLSGFNVAVLAYGQTGAGKTYTMSAIREFVVADLLQREDITALSFSFLEVYQDEIRDLLAMGSVAGGKPLQLFDGNGTNGTHVVGANRVRIRSASDLKTLLEHGERVRVTATTAMNKDSSRSHAIFVVYNSRTLSKLTLVDLAGSERAKKTKNSGLRLKESIQINTGLLALGSVIRALTANPPRSHIPYRSSKLTRMLQDSLGGNSKTLMIACVASGVENIDESVRTLQYASKAMIIHNEPLASPELLRAEHDECAAEQRAIASAEAAQELHAEISNLCAQLSAVEGQLREARLVVKKDEVIFADHLRAMKKLKRENKSLLDEVEHLRLQLTAAHATPQQRRVATDAGSPHYIPIELERSPPSPAAAVHSQTQLLANALDASDGVVTGQPPVHDEKYRALLTENLFYKTRCTQLRSQLETLSAENTDLQSVNRSLVEELAKINELLSC